MTDRRLMDEATFLRRTKTELLSDLGGWDEAWSAILHGMALVQLYRDDPEAELTCHGEYWEVRLTNGTSVTGPSLLGVIDTAFAPDDLP